MEVWETTISKRFKVVLSPGGDATKTMEEIELSCEMHINYFLRMLKCMPAAFVSLQCNRLLVLYFCVSGLDLLHSLDRIENKEEIIDWIYRHQCESGGFIGGSFVPKEAFKAEKAENFREGHITMTYTALLSLAILGDDYARLDRAKLIAWLKRLQNKDGSFQAIAAGSETDVRFTFSAAAISFMLQDYTGIDIEKAMAFLLSVQSYDGGIGMLPGQESHGDRYPHLEQLEKFLVNRQIGGFNGRINKFPDSCYTFWVGGALQVLGKEEFIDRKSARNFLFECESKSTGGFSKIPKGYPDILHSYMSISGFSIIGEDSLRPLLGVLGLSQHSFSQSPFADGKTATGEVL